MRALFLDLASHDGLLACVTEERTAASVPVDHRIGDAELMPTIQEMLERATWSFDNLDHIACAVGPGGFTSVRVAVAAANTIAWALKIPSRGIHLSDLYLSRISASKSPFLPLWWLHSTRKQELFVRGFGQCASRVPEARLERIDALLPQLTPGDLWTGELIPEHRSLIEARGLTATALRPLTETLPSFLAAGEYMRALLQPWYGRGW